MHAVDWKHAPYLFVGMWYSDKPVVQRELAERMASLMHRFPSVDLTMQYGARLCAFH